ncbi:MAG: NAD-dependent dehydratase [Candidatus Komeilibacteria bacterium CG10_big_fil_rev_8_21_14_0_10_41_13]|uniref:NAD-dependent dehydratase n=1 Tax=Candidatus Komeilibacteria bacterium CG10_big_fil_rev_8_21_14_0_10_41_13 TaxID=1974476 RepID=A0A2M6WDB0_9BACT|nr:MAG: NAD-dependent dehydratase [Candidatus Komeilibacteria bacterium CG10_big_fil_rev_8_21_14_0_10_41_13]
MIFGKKKKNQIEEIRDKQPDEAKKYAAPTGGKNNVLVIGGAGFIGSHLCEELLKDNNVVCLDNFITSNVENIRFLMDKPNFQFINHNFIEKIDLDERPELKKFKVEIFGFQEIYNLACPTSAKNFDNLIIDTALANSALVRNVLEMALQYNAKLVHASSAVVYGPRQTNNYVDESYLGTVDFVGPRSCYDEGKRFAESLISNYNKFNKKNFKIARIFRTYGPRLALKDGQMISDFIVSALDNQDLIIYGDKNFSTALVYISDVVDGLIKLMKSDFYGPINLGSNVDVLLSEVAQNIIDLTGSKSKVVYRDKLDFITALSLPDISLAKVKLGWYPVTSLEQGLEQTIEYTRANKQVLNNLINNHR